MLYDPERHEPLQGIAWDEERARCLVERIVKDTESRYSADNFWPIHPRDANPHEINPVLSLYHGACGVIWALHYLESVGAANLSQTYTPCIDDLFGRTTRWVNGIAGKPAASYMMGETAVLLLKYWLAPSENDTADRLERLITSNLHNPTRELMWGSPGTLLAALFLYEYTNSERWSELFRATARQLWSELIWSPEFECHYWTQDMYGQQSSYLDAVHGFVATASPLIRGRHLLDAADWKNWELCITNIIQRSATWEGTHANWRARLYSTSPGMLMQFCHGAPGFIICLADFPDTSLDEVLIAGGEATWAAGPLVKGSNLCHGTGGNGYAFLTLYRRTGDSIWLDRARAFAMHAIIQTEDAAVRYGQMHYSLWTGDLGFAIYLWHCICGKGSFPTLDVFFSENLNRL